MRNLRNTPLQTLEGLGGAVTGSYQKGYSVIYQQMHELGGACSFLYRIFHSTRKITGYQSAITDQIVAVSTRAMSTIIFAGLFVGAILVLQFESMLRRFDAQSLLGGLNTSATIREIGPLIISFLLAGKVGAYTTAELANMRVTEQIDAIESLGTDSIQYLIIPRFFAIVISSLFLLAIGLAVSVMGSLLVADFFSGMNLYEYILSIPRFVGLWTLFEGFIRCSIFSTIVATVSTYKGYTATGGARGVGKAVTASAIYINVYIVVANFISSSLLEWIHDFLQWVTS